MANRRMFAKTIIDSDAFLDMPLSTQSLYFHLAMRADDDGFVNNPKKIARMIGSNDDEMKVLLGKNFILGFETGIIVIKHWKLHNYIQKDRYTPTVYQEEKSLLTEKNNNVYTMDTLRIQNGNTGKVSIELEIDTEIDNKTLCASDNAPKGPSKKDINNFFEDIWKLYPEKKGKGSVSDTQKKKLFKLGYNVVVNCINRYKDYVEVMDYPYKNGSSFFNKGYIDYLDENYQQPKKRVSLGVKNKFNNSPQRDYDYDGIEDKALKRLMSQQEG